MGSDPGRRDHRGADALGLLAAITRIVERHPDQRVVVVSHGGVIGCLLAHATGGRPFAFVGADNASISHIVVTNGVWILRRFNDTGHLAGELSVAPATADLTGAHPTADNPRYVKLRIRAAQVGRPAPLIEVHRPIAASAPNRYRFGWLRTTLRAPPTLDLAGPAIEPEPGPGASIGRGDHPRALYVT